MSPIPESTSLQALLTAASFAPITGLGWLRVTGEDRVRWLNGMTTNSIQALKPGEGCYTFFLNAQGRIQADAYAWMQSDAILLETADAVQLSTLLDRFIIMDDVELAPLENRAGLVLAGPGAAKLLEALELTPELLLGHVLITTEWQAQPVDVLQTYSPLVPTFELWSDPATIGFLAESLRAAGAPEASSEALNQFRILSGIPLYSTDIRDRDLPQETTPAGIPSRALHFSKGCYLGQEIVERIHSRGAVHRAFSGFVLSGELPSAGTLLTRDQAPDKPAGELTSVVQLGERRLALGYVRHLTLPSANSAESKLLAYAGGTATPCTLPFSELLG